jgi:hypothetical protein
MTNQVARIVGSSMILAIYLAVSGTEGFSLHRDGRYLRSATQVGLLQIQQGVQLNSAKNTSKSGANPLTGFKSSLPLK